MALAGFDVSTLVINDPATGNDYSGVYNGVVAGQLVVVEVTACGDSTTSNPSGWTVTLGSDTLLFQFGPGTGTVVGRAAIFTGIASASGNLTLRCQTGGISVRSLTAVASKGTGYDPSAPIANANGGSIYNTDVLALSVPNGITTTRDGNMVLGCIGVQGGDTTALGVTGADGSTTGEAGNNANNDHEWGHAYVTKPIAGSVTFDWTWSTNASKPAAAWVEINVAPPGSGVSGDAAGTMPLAGTATGTVGGGGVSGAAAGSIPLGGAASGGVEDKAAASGTMPMAGAAAGTVGSAPVTGDGAGSMPMAGGATGAADQPGVARFETLSQAGSATITSVAALRVSIGGGAWQTLAAAGLTIVRTANDELTVSGFSSPAAALSARFHYEEQWPGEPYDPGQIDALWFRRVSGPRPANTTMPGLSLSQTDFDNPVQASGGGATGAASGQMPLAGAATGDVDVAAQATGQMPMAGAGAGGVSIKGNGGGQMPMAGGADGIVAAPGGVAGAASGQMPMAGAGAAGVTVQGSASGQIPMAGSASGGATADATRREARARDSRNRGITRSDYS